MLIYQRTRVADRCPAFLRTRRDARIVRLGEQALWLSKAGAAEALSVVVERADWEFIRSRCPGLPPFDALPRARRRDVLNAWLADAPSPARTIDRQECLSHQSMPLPSHGGTGIPACPSGDRQECLSHQSLKDHAWTYSAVMTLLREKLVACEGLEVPDALRTVEGLVAWASEAPDEPVAGRIAPASELNSDVRRLYLDTRPTLDWPAIARLPEPAAPLETASGPQGDRRLPEGNSLVMHIPADRCARGLLSAATAGGAPLAACTGDAAPGLPLRGGWTFAFGPAGVFMPQPVAAADVTKSAQGPPVLFRQLTFSFF